jgi:hypothetical protein
VSSYEEIERSEPALLAGFFAGGVGLLTLLAANFSLPHCAGLAVGMSMSQALLSRPAVVTPKKIEELVGSDDSSGAVADVVGATVANPRPDEPVATVGALVFVVGFLVQLFAGVDMATAFASAAGLAGVQTAVTRSRVYSPLSGQAIAARKLVANASKAEKKASLETKTFEI